MYIAGATAQTKQFTRKSLMTTQDQESNFYSFRQRPKGRYGIRNMDECGTGDRLAFPAQSSVLDEDTLRESVISLYDLPEIVSCRFMTRGDSDVYLIAASDDRRFYLKVYRPPHPLAVAEAEGQLTADLGARGFPVASPVRRRDGQYATAVDASEGTRPILLWTEAPGSRPGSEPASAEAIGRTIGQLHEVCDTLEGRYGLQANKAETVAELLPYALVFMDGRDADLAVAAAQWGRERMSAWPKEAPGFGICHGDLASVNIRSHPERGITLFDFGACGYTWRVCDFLRFHPGGNGPAERQTRWDAFRNGYSAVRALPEKMGEMLPIFRLMSHLGSMGRGSATCSLRMGTESPEGFLPGEIQSLREKVQGIPELRDHLGARALL